MKGTAFAILAMFSLKYNNPIMNSMQNYTWNVSGSISKQCKYMSWPIAMQKLMLVSLILKDELHAVG